MGDPPPLISQEFSPIPFSVSSIPVSQAKPQALVILVLLVCIEVRRVASMLKISTHEDDQMVRLQIEGTVVGCWVKELELSWRAARATLRGRSLWADLTGTTRVDSAGYYLLQLMHKEGVQFLASGPSMRALILEITGQPATGHEGDCQAESSAR